ncbi:hypothetical protein Hanom_Chr17g01523911 [Helianthus anomalus]
MSRPRSFVSYAHIFHLVEHHIAILSILMFPLKSKLPTFNLHLWIRLKSNPDRNNSKKTSKGGSLERLLIPTISPPHQNQAVISCSLIPAPPPLITIVESFFRCPEVPLLRLC